ncbi:GNAT family N-acetyltransferase [Paenibacillus sp. NPDC057934]|uniref:GNAT family N-acetyltransferase n=1 Tax=Paenibacillus sp. NPDC057934 TaxID=3346282 RepID=UPI0036DE3300
MVQLLLVPEDKQKVLYNLYQLYLHDFSPFTGEEINESGLYDISLEHYWRDSRWNPFFITSGEHIAGFLVVLFENQDTDPDPTHVIYDFMILRKFRRQGLGRAAAKLAFDSFKANWKVAQMSSNEAAVLFWREIIGEYTHQRYTESFRSDQNKYIQAFNTKDNTL